VAAVVKRFSGQGKGSLWRDEAEGREAVFLHKGRERPKYYLRIKKKTWQRDIHLVGALKGFGVSGF